MKRAIRFPLASLSAAILAGLSAQPVLAQSDDEDQLIEEVVATGTRLKGSATAVMQERKDQAFVADIMGAEQIARTGDSDAAGALRRITGLTLVDGKFIYVRGLGERYSSTLLNGASVPSPDPTRTVIPLDLFPSDIIESLSVQKSFSPSMPAAFGGGSVDIRLKSIPTDTVFNASVSVGGNTDNFDDAWQYDGGSSWKGKDDGTRAAPAAIQALWDSRTSLNDVSTDANRQLALDLNREYDTELKSVDPDFGFNLAFGDSTDIDDFRIGFLGTVGYDNEWQVSDQFLGEDYRQNQDGTATLVRGWDDVESTEHNVKWSGMLALGVDYNRNHRVDLTTVILNDTNDELREKLGNSNNINFGSDQRIREYDVTYEERRMVANQIKGMHTFTQWNFLGFDWKYSDSRSSRYAPGNVQTRFIITDHNEDGVFDRVNESILNNATTASRYSFQDLDDKVENYGWNLNYPLMLDKWDITLKAGADFIDKTRTASNRRFDVNARAFMDSSVLQGHRFADILNDDVILNAPLRDSILRDTTIAGDDYVSAQKVDAYYFEADMFFDNKWRISGGVRWEDFRQAVVPLDPADGTIDLPTSATPEDLASLAFQEDNLYPALALTYIMDDEMQLRFSYGETVVRPDLRELAPTTYLDPLTLFPVGGTPGLETTDIKNYDLRWEWYVDNGDNLSVALFYKDMENPIETVQSPAQDGPPLVRIANAETGEVCGVELEFLKGLDFLGDFGRNFYTAGNLTLSDSEIQLDTQAIVEQTGVSAAITNTERRLTGHSEYVLNLQLGFDSDSGEHSASVVYNVFGERIIIPGIEGRDDSYEKPFHSLDVVYTYYPDFNSTISFKVKNLLDEKKEITFSDNLIRSESQGIEFSLSYKREF
ncbi:TonB-dependent receptor domain-containing protein [Lacimicrobium alkaliphilum]|uniref:TonB-dependent receptor n=1 Tax=Lacimicrobium alkaliphilum TaxID=1526571 RepID=A0A0U2PIV3_9ALTE|nr:TonB-dependent receptor [Lacimicrobium alkaliphilum]ALS99421.1 TonB-dependent receptor [Lacimicrobium alkaliphilum]